jgi:hypothetical protein
VVALENLALRQQLAVFRRTAERPPLHPRDRPFWVLLAKAWREWRTALIVVQPETVVRWHRQWLRRRWTRSSRHSRPGRPSTNRRECLDHVIVFNQRHLRRTLTRYLFYYHGSRTPLAGEGCADAATRASRHGW